MSKNKFEDFLNGVSLREKNADNERKQGFNAKTNGDVERIIGLDKPKSAGFVIVMLTEDGKYLGTHRTIFPCDRLASVAMDQFSDEWSHVSQSVRFTCTEVLDFVFDEPGTANSGISEKETK